MPFDPDDLYTWPRSRTKIIDALAQDAINPRKRQPVATGVLAYFPDAILEVARVSEAGNRQHGTVGWDRTKSTDEFDALTRHLIDHLRGNLKDSDGQLHLAKAAWRALAALQRHMDSVK
ncbi:MAG: dATP/dGTP diphosphohydrolase domain-containing protein [Terriglobales bacterium]